VDANPICHCRALKPVTACIESGPPANRHSDGRLSIIVSVDMRKKKARIS